MSVNNTIMQIVNNNITEKVLEYSQKTSCLIKTVSTDSLSIIFEQSDKRIVFRKKLLETYC